MTTAWAGESKEIVQRRRGRERRIERRADERAGADEVRIENPRFAAVVPPLTSLIDRLPPPALSSETSSPVGVIETLTVRPAGGLASISAATSPRVAALLKFTALEFVPSEMTMLPLAKPLSAVQIGKRSFGGDGRRQVGRALNAGRERPNASAPLTFV